jgi:WD40 repeat protein
VYQLRFLPQGDRFVVRGFLSAIGIFSLAGQRIGDWIPATPDVFWSVFGIDGAGAKLAFAASANEIAVQELATGKLLRRWRCDVGKIMHVLLSPDGETVLAIGDDKIIAYSTQEGAPRWTQPSLCLPDFSPDGRTVAILAARSGPSLKVQLLDPRSGMSRLTLEATGDNPKASVFERLQFNQAGDRLACLAWDELILWNAKTGAKERVLHFPGEEVALLNPGGDAVATLSGGAEGATIRGSRIRLRDTATGRLLRSLNGAVGEIQALAFSPDGRSLLSSHISGLDGMLTFWPIRLGEEIAAVRLASGEGRAVFFDPAGSKFYVSAYENAGAWDVRSRLEQWRFSSSTILIEHLTVHPTDGSVVLSEFNKPAFTHFTSTGGSLGAFGTNNHSSLDFNRSGRLLLSVDGAFDRGNPGRAFSVMEYPTGIVLKKILFDDSHQPYAAFCLDDAAVATAATAGGITVWDWKAGTPLRQIVAERTGSIGCLAASPDGFHLVTGGPDRWIRVWEAATGRLESAFRAHWESVRCVKFSPNGREILSGGEDGTVRIHDAKSGERVLALYGNTTPVQSVNFGPDGTLIAAITVDGIARVWDRKTSSEAARLPQQPIAKTPSAAHDTGKLDEDLALAEERTNESGRRVAAGLR